MGEASVRVRFVAARGDRLIDGPGGRCPFLEDGHETSCKIYAVRPQRSRSWPYWDEFLDNPRALREAARLRPGIELSNLPLYPRFDSADDQRVFRLATILLSSLWLSGCFVAEEIRKGDALIEQHSVGWREKKERSQQAEEEAAKAEAEAQTHQARNTGPGAKSKLSEWWRETVDEQPVKADPSDKIVSCQIGGKLQFLRKSDCQLRRGQTTELKTKDESAVTAPSKPRPGA